MDHNKKKNRKHKNFLVPPALVKWLHSVLVEEAEGRVAKDWVYKQYVQFCRRGKMKVKEKTIFAKLFYQVFPAVTSRRMGSGATQQSCYCGVARRDNNIKKEKGKESESEKENGSEKEGERKKNRKRKTAVDKDSDSGSEDGKEKKTNRNSKRMRTRSQTKKEKKEEEQENDREQETLKDSVVATHQPVAEGERAAIAETQLLLLHRYLAAGETRYDTDLQRYLKAFVYQFWPRAPLQWNVSIILKLHTRQDGWDSHSLLSNTFILLVALYCGAVEMKEYDFAYQLFMICNPLAQYRIGCPLPQFESKEKEEEGEEGNIKIEGKENGKRKRMKEKEAEEVNVAVFLIFLARALGNSPFISMDVTLPLAHRYSQQAALMLSNISHSNNKLVTSLLNLKV